MLRNSFNNLSSRAKKKWSNRSNSQSRSTVSGGDNKQLPSSQVPSRDFSVLDLSSRNMTPNTLRLGVTPKMAQDVVELRLGLKEMTSEAELKEWLDMLVDYFPNLKHLYWLDSSIIANNNNGTAAPNKAIVQARRQQTLRRIPMLLSLDGLAFTDRERKLSGFHKLGGIIEQYRTLETEDRSFAAIFDRESTRMVLLLNVNHGFSMEAVISEMKETFLPSADDGGSSSQQRRRRLLDDIHRLVQEKRFVESIENIVIDMEQEDDPLRKDKNDEKKPPQPHLPPPTPRRARFDYVLHCYRAPDDYPGYEIPIQVFTRRVTVNESLEDIMNKLNGRFEAMG